MPLPDNCNGRFGASEKDSKMSLFGALGGQLENLLGGEQSNLNGLFQNALAQAGGYPGILSKLEQSGMGAQVESWLSANAGNLPINADQIRSALGDQHLQQLAASFGVPMDQVANLLAQHLPTAVDQASPNGALAPT